MSISTLAGKPAPREMLIDPVRLEWDYFERRPDLDPEGDRSLCHPLGAPQDREHK